MPPILKPGTHNQMLVPHQSLMRPFVLSLGTGDEKRQTKERKNWMLPLLPVNRGFDIASLCYRGVEINMETVREKKKRNEKKRERAVWACLLFGYLSLFSINSAAHHLTSGGQLSTEPRLKQSLQIYTYVINMNMDHFTSSCTSLTHMMFTTNG